VVFFFGGGGGLGFCFCDSFFFLLRIWSDRGEVRVFIVFLVCGLWVMGGGGGSGVMFLAYF